MATYGEISRDMNCCHNQLARRAVWQNTAVTATAAAPPGPRLLQLTSHPALLLLPCSTL